MLAAKAYKYLVVQINKQVQAAGLLRFARTTLTLTNLSEKPSDAKAAAGSNIWLIERWAYELDVLWRVTIVHTSLDEVLHSLTAALRLHELRLQSVCPSLGL